MGGIYASDLAGLTNLSADEKGIADLTGMEYCTSMTHLDLGGNQISDISSISGLTSLTTLYLEGNLISDIEPLVNNPGIDAGDELGLRGNPLNSNSIDTCIPALQGRGVTVYWDTVNQPPSQPSNVSPANAATGISLTPTAQSSAFSDPDSGDTHAASQWQITTAPGDYTSTVGDSGTDTSDLTSIAVPPGMLSANVTYYWHVRYQDNHGDWSEWSAETSFVTAVTDEVVTFPDPNLEAAIREAIGKPVGDIYASDLAGLTNLDASYSGIADLTGMEYCTSLTWLNLVNNQISDISPLSSLTSLTWLDLSDNQISDISPLSSLTSLTSLDLGDNQISDLSPLSSLTSLTVLYLYENEISDIEPLVNNPGLGQGDSVDLTLNPLNATSVNTYIPQLEARGVTVVYTTP